MAIKRKMTFQCQGGSSYILKSNRRSRKSSPRIAKACDAPQMPHVAGSRGRWGGGVGLGMGAGPSLTRSPGHGPVECHPGRCAWLARAHGPPSNSLSERAANFRTTRAALENCPQVKRDFFPADIALADPSLIFPFQNECCSFHFLK